MKNESKNRIEELTDRFRRNVDVYKNGAYNETQVRREFIDPFFKALGWDVANKAGYAEQYKDVVHEDSIKVGVSLKAPDYSFRIGGQRKFFLEAKKPSVKIKEDVGPAYQLRRYAWSAKLPLSIVTDFEEFAVYDCRVKPDPSDKVSLGRIAYYTYDQYLDKFDEIYDTFSKDAVLKGSFDRYIESTKVKKGTGEVDREFLKEIERWRDALARNLALRNQELDIHELNFAVQNTIDRIIFLRICEDRGIEGYGRLQGLLNGSNVYERLLQLFTQADKKYNSGLFDFKADNLSHYLKIDDKVLKEIIENLYYPKSPYEFSVLGADILGNVYEQFLGKVIRLTAGHQAKVEEKPEVKKAGGVYYTPQYIVEYIVKNTVGRLLDERPSLSNAPAFGTPSLLKRGLGGVGFEWDEGKPQGRRVTPKDVSKIRILDPACGSGSFLIGAYQYLLDWHLRWYRDNDPEKHAKGKAPAVYLGAGKEWRLTTQEKKRILLNSIYGVDIDRQAVEVTKLSLLLKLLENENEETVGKTMALFQERVLPSLENNIKCGNSLIGPDFYKQMEMGLADDDIRRVNVFDWEKEYPEIMKSGGFDAVIGNPPYLGGREWKEVNGRQYDYFAGKYFVAEYQFDIYALFWEQGIHLLKKNGLIGFITPNTWLNNKGCAKLRSFILDTTAVLNITDYSRIRVFPTATVLPIVTVLKKAPNESEYADVFIPDPDGKTVHLINRILTSNWKSDSSKIIHIDLRNEDIAIREKIETDKVPLDLLANVKFGIKLYETGKGTPPQKPLDAKEKIYEATFKVAEDYRPYLEGKDINRYEIKWQSRWLKYGKNLAAPREPSLFEGPRLLIRRIVGERLIGSFTDADYVTSQLLQIVKPHDLSMTKYLLGVLNSTLLAYYFRKKYNRQDKTFPEIRIYELASLPIRTIDFNKPADKALHDKMVSLVDRMLDLNKKLQTVKIAHEKEILDRQIKITDDQIDRLVYELYGLTEEERKIVEGNDK